MEGLSRGREGKRDTRCKRGKEEKNQPKPCMKYHKETCNLIY